MSHIWMRRWLKLLAAACLVLALLLWRSLAALGEKHAEDAAQARLDTRIAVVDFDGTPLKDAVMKLAEAAKVGVSLQRDALVAAGVWDDTPVHLKARDIKFSTALRLILDDAAAGTTELDFADDNGVLVISTAGNLVDGRVVMRVYDVGPILKRIAAERFELLEGTAKPGTDPHQLREMSAWDAAQSLLTGVDDSFPPNSSGLYRPGDVEIIGQRLLVLHSPEVQVKVAAYLQALENPPIKAGGR